MSVLAPFHLLQLHVISAQDLEPVCRRKMRTYAVVWVHPERKLSTRIDAQGHTNPTWNDNFVFRVDDEFLHRYSSALNIEIYAVHWFRDIHVGTVRVLVENLIQPVPRTPHRQELELGMRFASFQVWRPSGRSQGILNIAVALLNNSMRSMPLYLQMGSSGVGYRHLMDEDDLFQTLMGEDYIFQTSKVKPLPSTTKINTNNNQHLLNGLIKPELRRTKSDSSSILESDLKPKRSKKGSLIVNGGSMVNSRGSSMVNYVFDKSTDNRNSRITPPGKSPSGVRFIGSDYVATGKTGGPKMMTDSELGPSPSEMAAALAKKRNHNQMEEAEIPVGDKLSLVGSIEGLRSKLERWRNEIRPVYNRSNEMTSFFSNQTPSTVNKRRRRKNKKGVFSCFGNICGCEISLSCRKNY